jgi:hypothetical protein
VCGWVVTLETTVEKRGVSIARSAVVFAEDRPRAAGWRREDQGAEIEGLDYTIS